jgi:hypothetical protein
MNPARLALAALLAASCAAPRETQEAASTKNLTVVEPSLAKPQPRRHALLRPSFGLFASPKQAAHAIPARWTGEQKLGEGLGLFRELRYVGEKAGWVALETIPRDDWDGLSTCYDKLSPLNYFRLRLYAPSAALVTATTRHLRQDYADGTWVELNAGVALLPDGEQTGRFVASLNNLLVPIQLNPALTGASFEPETLPDTSAEKTPKTSILPAEIVIKGQVTINGQPLRRLPLDNKEFVFADTIHDISPINADQSAASIKRPCAKLRAIVPSAQIKQPEGWSASMEGNSGRNRLEPGTPLFWPDGKHAGEVVRTYKIPPRARAIPELYLECFSPATGVTICHKAAPK